MSGLSVYSFTTADLTELANKVKDALSDAMYNNGDTEDREELSSKYVVVVSKRSWLGRVFAKIRKEEDKGELTITVLKTITARSEDK